MSRDLLSQPATKQLAETYDYLAPDGSEIRLLVEGAQGGLAHCTLPPGHASKAVRHQTVEELWYVLVGTGKVWRKLGEKEEVIDASPGVSLSIPTGAHFQFRTTGETPLQILIATMPRWPGAEEAVAVRDRWT